MTLDEAIKFEQDRSKWEVGTAMAASLNIWVWIATGVFNGEVGFIAFSGCWFYLAITSFYEAKQLEQRARALLAAVGNKS